MSACQRACLVNTFIIEETRSVDCFFTKIMNKIRGKIEES